MTSYTIKCCVMYSQKLYERNSPQLEVGTFFNGFKIKCLVYTSNWRSQCAKKDDFSSQIKWKRTHICNSKTFTSINFVYDESKWKKNSKQQTVFFFRMFAPLIYALVDDGFKQANELIHVTQVN